MREGGRTRRRARKAREDLNRRSLDCHSDESKWEIDCLEDYGLDLVFGTTIADAERLTSTSTGQRLSSVLATVENSVRLDMHPIAIKADPTRLGLFDLPTELRVHIFELYCSLFGTRTTESALLRGPSGGLPHAALLKPQLVCHQLRDEFMDVWAICTTFNLPHQWLHWPWNRAHAEPEELARDETIQQLYFVIRDWLERVPKNMRHRLRCLRIAFIPPRYSWGSGQRASECLIGMRGEVLAGLMERLEVHEQLRFEVELGIEKYCCANHYRWYWEIVRFELKQRSPQEVQENGGDEWVCVNKKRRKIERRL